MADYNPNTVSAYQQYASSMSAGGGGSNMSGLGARTTSSGTPSSRLDDKGYTPTKSTSTKSGIAYIENYGDDSDNVPMTPEQIYTAAAQATTEVGGLLVPNVTAPMIHAANLYSMPNMVEQVSDYVYRADRDTAVREAISGAQAEEQDSVDAAIKSINKAITQGKTDAEIAEAFLNDMAGMGSDKPDETGGFGVPGVTLKDVTDTQQGLMTNPQPLYDFADEMANPSITTTELPPISPDQKEKLGAKLREASDKGDLSSVMNQLAQDSKVQLSSAVTNFIEGAETQVASNDIDPFTGLPVGNNELGFTDVSPAQEAPDQLGLMARSRVPTGSIEDAVREAYNMEEEPTPEVETPAVAEETAETEDTTITDLIYNDFVEGKQEGDEAHVGQDNKNITLAGGVVPDGLKYNGKDFEQDKSPVVGFDKTKLDTSGAYKKVGTVTVRRSDFDSDKAFAKGVIEEFTKQAKTAAGTNWPNMSEGSKKAVVKIGWNKGAGWYTGKSAKAIYAELAKDEPDPENLYSKVLVGSTVKGGGASIGIAKARANAWNETISATGGKEITRIDADNSGTNTAFKYYDKDGNLLHTEQTSRDSTIYENRLTSVSKNSKGVW